ncbi:hypothetical protein DRF62_01275 [Chryseobacterium piscium]|uniref:Uncharacterized protein n=1 Tax=Chryseobacterium piscium TaxID=333702 RepID=A0A3D9BUK5_9FLAO|nr:hypothetical protein [Chryseobacterium piscium]REC57187.1 hypothetical protein DRF62_01275 [Chryseobacterium piscium]
MKKIVSSIFFLLAIAINAQANFSLANNGQFLPQDNAIFNKVNSPNAGKNLSYSDIQGSPYYSKGYIVAKFSGSDESAPAKYNSYNDEVEFMKEDKPYVLPKNETFSTVTFTTTKETLVRLETNDELSGYFFELVNGKNILYKKVKTKFIDAVVAVNSYATDRPAVFKALEPVYYIKTENGFIKNPKNKKEIIDQIPEKKEALSAFFKENKIKFDKEDDLKKLVTFLNQ